MRAENGFVKETFASFAPLRQIFCFRLMTKHD